MSSIPENQRDVVKSASRVQDTRVTKMAKGVWGEFVDKADKIKSTIPSPTSGSEQAVNESANSSQDKQPSKTDNKVDNKPHKDSFDSSVSNNEKTIKPEAKLQATNAKIVDLVATPNSNLERTESKES